MANFEVSRRIQSDRAMDSHAVRDFIKEKLGNTSKFTVSSETNTNMVLEGRVKESVFTPMTKFEANVEVRVENDKARISIRGKSSPNWVFWIFFLVGLFTGIFLLIALVLFFVQRNKPKETFEGILGALETEFGKF